MRAVRRDALVSAFVLLSSSVSACGGTASLRGAPSADGSLDSDEPTAPTSWFIRLPGEMWELPSDVAVRGDGSIVLVGGMCAHFPGELTFWTSTIDPDGEVVEYLVADGVRTDAGRGLVATSDGGVLLAGSTPTGSPTGSDVWLAKTDPYGAILWQETLGGPGDELAPSVIESGAGGYVLAAASSSFSDSMDLWIARLDAGGGIEWQIGIGGPDREAPQSIAEGPDGTLYVASAAWSAESGESDSRVLALDPGMSVLWELGLGGPRDNAVFSLVPTADGVVLAGQTTHSHFTFGSCASWFVKVARGGEVEWQRVFNDGGCDSGLVFESGTGGPMAAGSVQAGAYGSYDLWFGAIDPDGGILGSVLVGDGSRREMLYAAVAYDADLVLAGTMGDDSGGDDVIVARIGAGGSSMRECGVVHDTVLPAADSLTTAWSVESAVYETDGMAREADVVLRELDVTADVLCP